jgi:hypothetical protein
VPIHSEFYDAWLYLPLASKSSTNSKPPVIIMGPGLVPISPPPTSPPISNFFNLICVQNNSIKSIS